MLFNSPIYIFCFLPLVVLGYFFFNGRKYFTAGKGWLVAASLFFYSYWNPNYLLLIVASILVNYVLGSTLSTGNGDLFTGKSIQRRAILFFGVLFNLGLLCFFKYTDFILLNINVLTGMALPLPHLVLPLAISFFTFQQIGYLLDSYSRGTQEYDFLHYCLFVTFFPQLIAGPIVRHQEMMPQFKRRGNTAVDWDNICRGIFIFSLGLFKKVVIADSFALWANAGFGSDRVLSCPDAWIASLSYTLQIYYDFSGYSDMAIGAALLFNIRLPVNFDSPYTSLSIQEFWRRWHITLSNWLRDYLYIPLGGNRTVGLACRNVLITFFLGGLWHGAGWTFVIWGLLHGTLTVINRLWQLTGLKLPRFLAWLLTFLCLNLTFVVFRAESLSRAMDMLKSMIGVHGRAAGTVTGEFTAWKYLFLPWEHLRFSVLPGGSFLFLLLFGTMALLLPNSLRISGYIDREAPVFRRNVGYGITTAVIAGTALSLMLMSKGTEFLYFNF